MFVNLQLSGRHFAKYECLRQEINAHDRKLLFLFIWLQFDKGGVIHVGFAEYI